MYIFWVESKYIFCRENNKIIALIPLQPKYNKHNYGISQSFLIKFLNNTLPQHCACVVDVRKITTDTYTDTRCFTDCNIQIWLNIQFYALLYGSMGPQHCVRVVDARKITTDIYTDTRCFTDQWGHYFTVKKMLCMIWSRK
jgi:hypothetical protein